jgi:hypothetical protein
VALSLADKPDLIKDAVHRERVRGVGVALGEV